MSADDNFARHGSIDGGLPPVVPVPQSPPRIPRDAPRRREPSAFLESAARELTIAVWHLVRRGIIDARSPVGDAALDVRDAIDPAWEPLAGVPIEPRITPEIIDSTELQDLRRKAALIDLNEMRAEIDGDPLVVALRAESKRLASVLPATGEIMVQNRYGHYVPAIPEPFWVGWRLRKARCDCGATFRGKAAYEGHYALVHVLHLGRLPT